MFRMVQEGNMKFVKEPDKKLILLSKSDIIKKNSAPAQILSFI